MCKAACSESGKLLSIVPCEWYKKLQQERDILTSTLATSITQLEALTDLLETNLKKLGKRDDECLMDFVERLVKIHKAADVLVDAVEDELEIKGMTTMICLTDAAKAYKETRDVG